MSSKTYPAGCLVRIADICKNPKTQQAGILPIGRTTWHKWVKAGKAPQPKKMNGTPVWPIEQVLALAE